MRASSPNFSALFGNVAARSAVAPGEPATAPAAFTAGQWSVADRETDGEIRITITALPDDGGSAITDLEHRIDAGTAVSLAGTTTGDYDVGGLVNDVEVDVQVRAVNAEGSGDWSDIKAVTPTEAAGATPFIDDFNRPDENLEDSADWTRVGGSAGDIQVVSNTISLLATSSIGTLYQSPDLGSADHYTEITIGSVNADAFPACVRATNANNFIGARPRGSTWQMHKRVSGTFTLLGSGGGSPTVGDRMRLEVEGDSISLYRNDTLIVGPITDDFNNTETRQGIVTRSSSETGYDDYEAGLT